MNNRRAYRSFQTFLQVLISRLRILILVCTLPSFVSVLPLYAQYGGYAGASVQIGFDASHSSLGNTGTAGWIPDTVNIVKRVKGPSLASSPYYNPALIAGIEHDIHVNVSIFELGLDRQYQSLSALIPLPPKAGLFIGLIRSGVHDIDARSLSGYPLGQIHTSEIQLQSAFGIRLSRIVHAGIGFKINRYNLHEDLKASTSVGLDLGMVVKLNRQSTLAISIQDLLAEHTWNSGDLYNLSQSANRVERLPTRFKAGYSSLIKNTQMSIEYEIRKESSEIKILNLYSSGSSRTQYIEQTETRMTNSQFLRAGISQSLHPTFRLNAGYEHTITHASLGHLLSTGFSLEVPQVDSFIIDYAFVKNTYGLNSMHIFTLRYIL